MTGAAEGLCLTMVVPCFNEAARIDTLVGRLTRTADDAVGAAAWELLVVDDSSTDATAALVAASAAADERVRMLRPSRGKGKGAAVRAGLLAARGELVFVTDADLAGDPAQLVDAIALLHGAGADVVAGSRVAAGAQVEPPRPLRRRLPAAVFRRLAASVGDVEVSDPQCGFKLFRREPVVEQAAALTVDGFAYEIELLGLLAAAGATIAELPIRWSASTSSEIRVVRDGVRMAADVVTIRLRRRPPVVSEGTTVREGAAVREGTSVLPAAGGTPHRRAVSVVMPVYDEAAVIADVVAEVCHHVLDRADVVAAGGGELVLVDDRGTDGSSAILARLAAADERLRLVVNPVNRGHGPSVLTGLAAAVGDWLLQLDSDGQVDLADFDDLWSRRHEADLVFATRVDRDDPRHRLVLTRAVNALVSALARRRVVDSNAGFKLLSRPLYEHLRPTINNDTFAPSLLFVLGAQRAGARTVAVPVRHRSRAAGPSSLNVRRLAAAVGRATVQTIAYALRPVPAYTDEAAS